MFTLGFRSSRGGGQGDRRRRRRSWLRPRHRRASTASTGTSAYRHRVVARRVVDRRRPLDVEVERSDTRRDGAPHLLLPVHVQRLLQTTTRATRPTSRAASASPGTIVHPQHWPEDLDYAGKRVVVIGSGATAVTLVPALAEARRPRDHAAALADAISSRCPAEDRDRRPAAQACCPTAPPTRHPLEERHAADGLLPALPAPARAHEAVLRQRAQALAAATATTSTRTSAPLQPLGPAAVPGARRRPLQGHPHGQGRVVTDPIETFTETGIKLELRRGARRRHHRHRDRAEPAAWAACALAVDGERVEPAETDGLQGHDADRRAELAFTLGYTNASWTLKADLVSEFVCRLLPTWTPTATTQCVPRRDPSVKEAPFIDFTAGYIQRSIEHSPSRAQEAVEASIELRLDVPALRSARSRTAR